MRSREPTRLGIGFDVEVWRISEDLVVRLPRRQSAFVFVEREIAHLPHLPQRLPLAIPRLEGVGVACDELPGPWFVTQYLPGVSGNEASLASCARGAEDLGVTLAAIHAHSTEGVSNVSARGVPIETRRSLFEHELAKLPRSVASVSRAYFDEAARAEQADTAVFLHGDVHRSNLMVSGGRPTALIDFGDLGYGDQAGDLGGGIFSVGHLAQRDFLDSYGSVSNSVVVRSLGWACYLAVRNYGVGDTYALEFLESLPR